MNISYSRFFTRQGQLTMDKSNDYGWVQLTTNNRDNHNIPTLVTRWEVIPIANSHERDDCQPDRIFIALHTTVTYPRSLVAHYSIIVCGTFHNVE